MNCSGNRSYRSSARGVEGSQRTRYNNRSCFGFERQRCKPEQEEHATATLSMLFFLNGFRALTIPCARCLPYQQAKKLIGTGFRLKKNKYTHYQGIILVSKHRTAAFRIPHATAYPGRRPSFTAATPLPPTKQQQQQQQQRQQQQQQQPRQPQPQQQQKQQPQQ